jgi:hypothetical protein
VTATATVTRSTFLGNQAVGGTGPTGGVGRGGALANLNGGVLTVSESLIALNRAVGGAGSAGSDGTGQGGGVFNGGPVPIGAPTLTLLRSVVALNRADGDPGQGDGLFVAPGGVAAADLLTVFFGNDVAGDLGEI